MFSFDLQRSIAELAPQQRFAISVILEQEARGVSRSRLLKTPYSCQWCGWFAHANIGARDERKAALARHESACERGPLLDPSTGDLQRDPDTGEPLRPGRPWKFISTIPTYYKWMADEKFSSCLEKAAVEFSQVSLAAAVAILRDGAAAAASELVRQIRDGSLKANEKRLAANSVLDRADLTTALKANEPGESDKLMEFLLALRDDDPPAAPGRGD